ncbi:ABC transporter ATP-binding protein [Gayadomonas joobiniege]|uniref:ABC transporter ATP-binding protein n=1 Tax=Gayadomonas joobiniege TaxID=1234606 RepID=UPI00037AF9FA|nr:ATP-binding cassette domain-containing protein [Gayadomonas joobiniege]
MIQIKNLTKRFGDFIAVDQLNLTINAGDIVGFLGPNGAGKSTTMKMITGFMSPSSGNIVINDKDIQADDISAKKVIGYLPEGAPAYADMTVIEFLNFIAEARGLKGKQKKTALARVCQQVELDKMLNKTIETLSKGYKRRVGLAQALIHDPQILILDEPTDGLDPNQKHQVRNLIKNLAKEKIVIISTHILEEVEAVCNRAVIIAKGKKVFDDNTQALRSLAQQNQTVKIEFEAGLPDISQLKLAPGVKTVNTLDNNTVEVTSDANYNGLFSQILDLVHLQGWQVNAMYLDSEPLDKVFRQLTEEAA